MIHLQNIHSLKNLLAERKQPDFFSCLLLHRTADKIHQGNSRNLQRILEGHENTVFCSLVHGFGKKFLALEHNASSGNLVSRVSHNRISKRRLSRAVRPHKNMGLSLIYCKIQAVQNFLLLHTDCQILYL